MTKRAVKTKLGVTVRAFDIGNDGQYGIIRMAGSHDGRGLRGICVPFVKKGREIALFEKDDERYLFGTYDDSLLGSFRTIPLALRTKLPSYIESKFRTIEGPNLGREDYMNAFLKIPVSDLMLDERGTVALDRLSEVMQANIGGVLGNLVPYSPSENSKSPSSVMRNRCRGFPKIIVDEAVNKSEILVQQGNPSFSDVEYVRSFYQRPRIFSTPTGGMPQWIKDFQRRMGGPRRFY